ncbi:DUF3592 domain-containing protein [Rubritalea tangerina]|uniref:DUF3592 domain-containing protein n=1 Tax=Rubritalea tangerina TaxID=430798 RepID=UPI00360B0551
MDTRKWVETPCLVVQSEVEKRSAKHIAPEYRWLVTYTYQYEGKHYTSALFKPIDEERGQRWGKSIEKVKKRIEEYPIDLQTTCYVNPDEPELAVLEHDTKAAGYSIWFPALFSIGGIGMMVGAVRGAAKK